jgi:hypothetical protein
MLSCARREGNTNIKDYSGIYNHLVISLGVVK